MEEKDKIINISLDEIIPNRFQPRVTFDEKELNQLANSISRYGVIQPIVVRNLGSKYEIIAGERRYKAARLAGLKKIPAIVNDADDEKSAEIALLENLQRKDLSPIEEARTFQKILELEENMTQEELAANVGKTQSSVSNKLRLLTLPEEVQDALLKNKISERHARSLLNIEDKNDQVKMLDRIIEDRLTVRDLEKQIRILKGEEVEEDDTPDDNDDTSNEEESVVNSSEEPETKVEEKEEETTEPETEVTEEEPDVVEEENNDIEVDDKVEEVTEPERDVEEKSTNLDLSKLFSSISSSVGKEMVSDTDKSSSESESSTSTSSDDASGGVNYREAVTKIRNMVRELKSDGQSLTMIEREEDNDYVVKITINKQ